MNFKNLKEILDIDNKKYYFLKDHLLHSEEILSCLDNDLIIQFITHLVDFYLKVYKEQIGISVLESICKLITLIKSDKRSNFINVIESIFKILLDTELLDYLESLRDQQIKSFIILLLDSICQNQFLYNYRNSNTSNNNDSTGTPNHNYSTTPSSMTPNNNNHSYPQSPLSTPIKNITLSTSRFLSPSSTITTLSSSTQFLSTPNTPSLSSSTSNLSLSSSSFVLPPSSIIYHLKDYYISILPLLFKFCQNDKNYRELKKYFGNNLIENEAFQLFHREWSNSDDYNDKIRCVNFILSIGNHSIIIKDHKSKLLNIIIDIINFNDDKTTNTEMNSKDLILKNDSIKYIQQKGIECLELHLLKLIDVDQFYFLIVQEIFKHQEKFENIFKKLSDKHFSQIIEPNFIQLFKSFSDLNSFNMINILIKSMGQSFKSYNEYILKIINILIDNPNNEKYLLLESILYITKFIGTKDMNNLMKPLIKYFKTIQFIKLDQFNTLEYESIIKSLVQLYKFYQDNNLFSIAIYSITNSSKDSNSTGMIILGELLIDYYEQIEPAFIISIKMFIDTTCLCKKENILPQFLSFYYNKESSDQFNNYIESLLENDLLNNINQNYQQQQETNIDDEESKIQDECRIKSFTNALNFIKLIKNQYPSFINQQLLHKVLEKLAKSITNVFLYSKNSTNFILTLVPHLAGFIYLFNVDEVDQVFQLFLENLSKSIYGRKQMNATIQINHFIQLLLILNNEIGIVNYYGDIIKQYLLYYRHLYHPGKEDPPDFTMFLDRKENNILQYLDQVLSLCTFKFLKKLILIYPIQLSNCSTFKSVYQRLPLKKKESILKIILSNLKFMPALDNLYKFLNNNNIYLPINNYLLNNDNNNNNNNNNNNQNSNNNLVNNFYKNIIELLLNSKDSSLKTEWKVSLSFVSKEWFKITEQHFSTKPNPTLSIKKTIALNSQYCLFKSIPLFKWSKIINYPMDQLETIMTNSSCFDLHGIDNQNLNIYLHLVKDIKSFSNVKTLKLQSIQIDYEPINQFINQIINSNNLVKFKTNLNLNQSINTEKILLLLTKLLKNNLNLKIIKFNIISPIRNLNQLQLIQSIINLVVQFNSNNSNNNIKLIINGSHPDDRFLTLHNSEEVKRSLKTYYSYCTSITIDPLENPDRLNYQDLLNIETLHLINCDFSIFFQINFLALLENTNSLKKLYIDTASNLNDINETFSFLSVNSTLVEIHVSLDTTNYVQLSTGTSDYRDIYSGLYFQTVLNELFQLFDSSSLRNIFLSTHNSKPILDDFSNINTFDFEFIDRDFKILQRSKFTTKHTKGSHRFTIDREINNSSPIDFDLKF
ncbi:hypothetical protein CYY_005595 [Polysphondylium violaceum]|uniref:Uncharacterized protein n=1 Tax=Polysphondylium violaceum TaxID=133409 RepID=A0A8J4PTK0_9MYCE|nr:hypothetical protein CYY_005595 [Polysphondylium violaceum]